MDDHHRARHRPPHRDNPLWPTTGTLSQAHARLSHPRRHRSGLAQGGQPAAQAKGPQAGLDGRGQTSARLWSPSVPRAPRGAPLDAVAPERLQRAKVPSALSKRGPGGKDLGAIAALVEKQLHVNVRRHETPAVLSRTRQHIDVLGHRKIFWALLRAPTRLGISADILPRGDSIVQSTSQGRPKTAVTPSS